MLKVNALKLRQNLGEILKMLESTGEPILLERGRQPVGVIISLDDFQKRFVDLEADRRREELVARIKAAQLDLPPGKSSLDLIREIRS
jgi:prevent-host-death family protein